jgi:putative flippase GtrA
MRAVGDKFPRFVISGIGTAALFLLLSYSFMLAGMSPFWGTLLAYALAFLAGYTAQRNWTFGSRHSHAHSLPRYLILQAICGMSSGLFAKTAAHLFGFSPFALSVITTGVVGLISFIVSSLWVFPDGRLADGDAWPDKVGTAGGRSLFGVRKRSSK